MASQAVARRLRASSEFSCSHCGGHEAYTCAGKGSFQSYLLNALAIQPARCCDCDALCYAFPVRPHEPVLNGFERTALVQEERKQHPPIPATLQRARTTAKAQTLRKYPRTTSRPLPPSPFHGASTNWAAGA